MAQVFLSHSSKDKLVADKICLQLESSGVKCWIAPRDVEPGRDYAEEIFRALQECTLVILVLSADSVASRDVQKEIAIAAAGGLGVLPFKVGEVTLTGALAYHLQSAQWLDATQRSVDAALVQLVAAVQASTGASHHENESDQQLRSRDESTQDSANRQVASSQPNAEPHRNTPDELWVWALASSDIDYFKCIWRKGSWYTMYAGMHIYSDGTNNYSFVEELFELRGSNPIWYLPGTTAPYSGSWTLGQGAAKARETFFANPRFVAYAKDRISQVTRRLGNMRVRDDLSGYLEKLAEASDTGSYQNRELLWNEWKALMDYRAGLGL